MRFFGIKSSEFEDFKDWTGENKEIIHFLVQLGADFFNVLLNNNA
ncbi:hypothetical protein [Bacillus sp. JJ1521]